MSRNKKLIVNTAVNVIRRSVASGSGRSGANAVAVSAAAEDVEAAQSGSDVVVRSSIKDVLIPENISMGDFIINKSLRKHANKTALV